MYEQIKEVTRAEAADILGYSVGYLRQLEAVGSLPRAARCGRYKKYRLDDILEYQNRRHEWAQRQDERRAAKAAGMPWPPKKDGPKVTAIKRRQAQERAERAAGLR